MLSALSEVETKVGHLDKGADDYLAKPFKTAELVARIKALVRRPKAVDISTITYSNLIFDEFLKFFATKHPNKKNAPRGARF